MTSIFDDYINPNYKHRSNKRIQYANSKPEKTNSLKIRIKVFGKVQGVAFRFTTAKLANDMNVNGIVRNENDGTVYIEAISDEETIDKFILEIAKGPSPRSNVEKIIVTYDETLSNYNGFHEEY